MVQVSSLDFDVLERSANTVRTAALEAFASDQRRCLAVYLGVRVRLNCRGFSGSSV